MKLRLSSFLFVLLACASQASFASWKCEPNGVLKEIREGNTLEIPSAYCWSEDSIVSLNCQSKKKCKALESVKIPNAVLLENHGPLGSPGFRLCILADGTPEFVEFKSNDSWKATSICRFTDDHSFISIGFWEKHLVGAN